MEIDDRLTDIFCNCFGEKFRGKLTMELSMDNVAEWDSLSFIDLITALEEAYEVKFSQDEMSEMNHLANIVTILSKKVT